MKEAAARAIAVMLSLSMHRTRRQTTCARRLNAADELFASSYAIIIYGCAVAIGQSASHGHRTVGLLIEHQRLGNIDLSRKLL